MAFACYIAVINCTKEHGGDQAEYWGVYEGVPIYGLRWAIDHIYGYRDATNGKEFMNGIYNYVGYWLVDVRKLSLIYMDKFYLDVFTIFLVHEEFVSVT